MPVIDFGALQPVIDNTGFSAGLSAGLSEVHGYLGSPQKNGLANLNSQQPPSFAKSIQSSYPNPRPGLPQPLRVDFKGKAESLYGQDVNGKDIIQKFLNKLSTHSDENAAFQDLVNEYDQESFDTPGNINPKMNEIMETYEAEIIKSGRDVLKAPNDIQKHNGSNGFYAKLTQMANTLRPRLPPAAESTAADPPAADPPAPPKAWYKFWGGRKTALIRSRNRSGKKTRARKMKQRSRKRAVRRR